MEGSVTASLEGMRVVKQDGVCRLEEYNFVSNKFSEVDSQPWPLCGNVTVRWLTGWNAHDRGEAIALLQ
jgi:hypothetical protein